MTGRHPVRSSRGATLPLLVFAAAYVVPLAFASEWWWSAGSAGVGILVAAGSWFIACSDLRPVHGPSSGERRAVAATSIAEAAVLAAAIAVGIAAGAWWLALPLLLTAVAVHILTLGIAFRRVIDAWSVSWMTAAAAAVWGFGASAATWTWPLCGAAAAGVCIGYVLAVQSARRRSSLAPVSATPRWRSARRARCIPHRDDRARRQSTARPMT